MKVNSLEKNQPQYFFIGCEALGGTDWGNVDIADLKRTVSEAYDYGITSFDVADCYGLGIAEKNLSDALAEKRFEANIATKGGVSWRKTKSRAITEINLSPSYIEKAFYCSLKRLRLDKIPLYYLHYPSDCDNFKKSLSLLNDLKNKGLLGKIGLSNINSAHLNIALRICNIDVIQLPVNILNKTIDTRIAQTCVDHKINIVSYNTLASGLLSGKYNLKTRFYNNDRRSRIEDFSGEKFKRNIEQVERIKINAKESGEDIVSYSITRLFRKYSAISSAIVGLSSREQLLDLHRLNTKLQLDRRKK